MPASHDPAQPDLDGRSYHGPTNIIPSVTLPPGERRTLDISPDSTTWTTLEQVMQGTTEMWNWRNAHPDFQAFKTSIPGLDELAGELFLPGNVVLFVGPTGRGKTQLLIGQVAVALAMQVPVGLLSLEDRQEDLPNRMVGMLTGRNLTRIRQGFSDPAAPNCGIPADVIAASEHLSQLPIAINRAKGMDIIDIALAASEFAAAGGAGGAFAIDQLSKIRPTHPRRFAAALGMELDAFIDEVERGKEFAIPACPTGGQVTETQRMQWTLDALNVIAERLNLLILLNAQSKIDVRGDSDGASLKDLSGSLKMAEEAGGVLMIDIPDFIDNPAHRKGDGTPARVPNDAAVGHLALVKSRFSPEGRVPIRMLRSCGRFVSPEHADLPIGLPEPTTGEAAELMASFRSMVTGVQQAIAAPDRPALGDGADSAAPTERAAALAPVAADPQQVVSTASPVAPDAPLDADYWTALLDG